MTTVKPDSAHNDLPLLPPSAQVLRSPEILDASLNALGEISNLRATLWQDKQNPTRAMQLMKPLFVPEAVTSSRVENIVTTNEEVYRANISAQEDLAIELRPSAAKEVLNYVDALQDGARRIQARGFLSTNDFIGIQRLLEPSKTGLRKLPGTTLSNPATGKIYYTPPSGEENIRKLLDNYEQYFNDPAPNNEVLARMAVMHYQFEAIHPFYDGNGRTGRMLMPLYLMAQKQLDIPVLFISRYILDNRENYYAKLRGVTFDGNWQDWILFIIQGTEQQAKFTSQMLNRVKLAMAEVQENLQSRLPKFNRPNLVQFIFSEPYFTVQGYMNAMSVSRPTANAHLEILEGAGIVRIDKEEGRNRLIISNPKYIEVLNES